MAKRVVHRPAKSLEDQTGIFPRWSVRNGRRRFLNPSNQQSAPSQSCARTASHQLLDAFGHFPLSVLSTGFLCLRIARFMNARASRVIDAVEADLFPACSAIQTEMRRHRDQRRCRYGNSANIKIFKKSDMHPGITAASVGLCGQERRVARSTS